MSDNEENLKAYPCPECGGGVRHLRHITYFTWLHQQLITVPNFPAWVCDLCGRRDYDTRAISWLNTMLSSQARPSAGHSISRPGSP